MKNHYLCICNYYFLLCKKSCFCLFLTKLKKNFIFFLPIDVGIIFNKIISSRNFHLRFINKICILQNISVKNVDMSFSSWPSNQMCINSIKKKLP